MYSVLRIGGISSELEKLLKVLERRCPELNPEINRTGMLVANLSQTPGSEHWPEVAEALDHVSNAVTEAAVGDIGLMVDTAFYRKPLPDGGVVIETMSVSHIALEAMASIGADFEATVYPVSEGEA